MSKSTPALLKAIEGYSAEHTGQGEHETNIALLARVKGEIEKGKGGDTISPGRREAASVQKNMPSEEDHDGGEGNKTTNRPGSFPGNEPPADPQANSSGERTLTNAGPAPSDGHLRSTLTGEVARGGIVDMRRQAAIKGLEDGRTSEGNKDSNPPGKAGPNEKRIGDVGTPAKEPADRNTGEFEGVPPFAKESLSGDGWTRAREKARKMAPAPR
jgi:hypothetical protein